MARDVGSLSPSPDSLTHVLGEAVVPVSLRMTENQRTGLTISIIVTCQRIAGFQNTAWKTALAASGGMSSRPPVPAAHCSPEATEPTATDRWRLSR